MDDDCVKHYELEWVREQIWALEEQIRELQMENTLLRQDLDIIKNEGCWRFIENPKHQHKQQCSKCGMTFEGVTNYYCPQTDCPIFLKAR